MLEKIKSLYITKNILIFLNEKRKLKVIKYSKILKNKLDIQLINYQLFSGRYIFMNQIQEEKNIMDMMM